MRTDQTTNYTNANALSVRELRLVISINFGTDAVPDLIYFTSHSDVVIPGATVYPACLKDCASVSQKLNPLDGRSEIGAISFELVDFSEQITELFRVKQNALKGLRGSFVRLYSGFAGLAWADYRLEQTQQIHKSVTYDNGKYKINCQDIQREQKKDIFKRAKTRLSANVATAVRDANGDAITASISVYDTSSFKPNWHGSSYSLQSVAIPAGTLAAPRGLYIFKIKLQNAWEICAATGKTATSFTNVFRGLFGTKIAAYEIEGDAGPDNGPEIEEVIYLEMPALKLWYALLTGKLIGQPHTLDAASGTYKDELPDDWHLGIDPNYVDYNAFVSASDREDLTDLYKSSDDSGYIVRFDNCENGDGKKFIETEIALLIGVTPLIKATGKISLKRMSGIISTASYVDTLDQTNIADYSELTHDLDAMVNDFKINWAWLDKPEGTKFYREHNLADSVSKAIHEISKPIELKFKGLHAARHTENTLRTTFNALRDRYSGPPERITLKLLPSKNAIEVGDLVRVNLPQVRDFNNNDAITIRKLARTFEVQGVTIDQSSQVATVQLFGASRKADPISYFSTAVLPDGWYGSGATLWPQTTSGGISTATANIAAGVYYFNGDLTINHDVTISGTVWLRVKGTLTLNARINGKGRSGASAGAYFGDTISMGGVEAHFKPSRGGVLTKLDCWNNGVTIRGRTSAVPKLNIENKSGTISGAPTDLNGSKGGAGGVMGLDNAGGGGSEQIINGGNGGNGGAGFGLVCRGLVFGAGGYIDTSGDDGALGASTTQGSTNTTAYAGSGAGGAPGACIVLFDGKPIVPVWNGRIVANFGDTPKAANSVRLPQEGKEKKATGTIWRSYYEGKPAEDAWAAAFEYAFIPQSLTPYEDYSESPTFSGLDFAQTTAPTNNDAQLKAGRNLQEGDRWTDTDDGNKPYRHNGSAWVVVQDGAIAAASAAATAAQNAANSAQTDATRSIAELGDIAADGKLTASEKRRFTKKYTELTNEQSGIDAQATALGIVTEKNTYDAAITALTTYLDTLTGDSTEPAWNDFTYKNKPAVGRLVNYTTIDANTFNSKWNAVYSSRQALLNKIADESSKRADWSKVSSRPTDAQLLNNLIDPSVWVVGAQGTQGAFACNGSASENNIVLGVGPSAATEPLWQCGVDAGSDADGGWNCDWSNGYDPNKTYRYSVWIKQTNTNGTVYLGCGNANNISGGGLNTNPYFWNGDLPQNNKWYLVIGLLHGASYSGGHSNISGVYDPETGLQLLVGSDFRSIAGATIQTHRAYLYYSTDLSNYAYLARPRVDLVDGSEATIAQLLTDGIANRLNNTSELRLIARNYAKVIGNSIYKTVNSGAWDSDVSSSDSYTNGAFCSFAVATVTGQSFMIGLNSDPTTDQNYTSIDYCWYITTTQSYTYESGTQTTSDSGAAIGDVFSVKYDGSRAVFEKNGIVVRTVSVARNQKFFLDSSLAYAANTTAPLATNLRFGPLTSNNWADLDGRGYDNIQNYVNVDATDSGQWLRVAAVNGAGGRGSYRCSIWATGGGFTPARCDFDVSTDWVGQTTIHYKKSGAMSWLSQVRVTYDGSQNVALDVMINLSSATQVFSQVSNIANDQYGATYASPMARKVSALSTTIISPKTIGSRLRGVLYSNSNTDDGIDYDGSRWTNGFNHRGSNGRPITEGPYVRRNSGDSTGMDTIVQRINNSGRAQDTRFFRASQAWQNTLTKTNNATLSTSNSSGNCSIAIAAWTAYFDYAPSGYAYPSGNISGLTANTVYYVYAIDANGDGTGVTYAATTAINNVNGTPDRGYVGWIKTPATSGGSGGGSGECVCVDMFVDDLRKISDVRVGDWIECPTYDDRITEVREVLSNPISIQPCVRITTENGAVIECSTSTPFRLQGGEIVYATEMLGREVLAEQGIAGAFAWEQVIACENIGEKLVCKTDVGNWYLLAGKYASRRIASHNISDKPPY